MPPGLTLCEEEMAAAGQGKQHKKESKADERRRNATRHEIDNASIYVKNCSMIAVSCAWKSPLTMIAGLTDAMTQTLILASVPIPKFAIPCGTLFANFGT